MSPRRGGQRPWAVLLLPALLTGCYDFSVQRYCERHPDFCHIQVDDVDPPIGFVTGGDLVLLHGSAFETDTHVTIDGVSVPTTLDTSFQLTVQTPAHAAGQVDLTVTSSLDQLSLPKAFRYVENPFRTLTVSVAAAYPISSFDAADFDRDGKPDLVLAELASGYLRIMRNMGDLQFIETNSIPPPSESFSLPTQILARDLNHDGNPDVVVAYCCGNVGVMLGNGNGTFQPLRLVAAAVRSSGPFGIDLGDLNGDGTLDLVAATETGVNVLLGNGDGTFQAPYEVAHGLAVHNVHLQDVDGDHHLDLLTSRWSSADTRTAVPQAFVSFGSEDGTFPITLGLSIGTPVEDIAAADLDGDGILDLVTSGSGDLAVLRGAPGGTYGPVQHHETRAGGETVLVQDLDGDGHPDVLTTNNQAPVPSAFALAIGTGDGDLLHPLGLGAETMVQAALLLDLDPDGKPDLVFATRSTGLVVHLAR